MHEEGSACLPPIVSPDTLSAIHIYIYMRSPLSIHCLVKDYPLPFLSNWCSLFSSTLNYISMGDLKLKSDHATSLPKTLQCPSLH